MSIKEYKLKELTEIINGKDLHSNISLNEILTNKTTKMIYTKTSCFKNGYQLKPTFFVKEQYIDNHLVPKLVCNRGDLVISKACNVGQPSFIMYDNTAIYRALTKLVPYENKIKMKYLFYVLIKNMPLMNSLSNGTTIKTIDLKTLSNFVLKIPDIKTQQQIIDIIEPKENLFIKYKDLVNIESLDEFKKTWSILIDIIEPFEKFKQNTNRILSMISNLMDLINLYAKPIGLMKDFKVIFEKGKNIPSDLITTSETKIPFINVSAINNNINKYIIENDIFHKNITYGDVVLSLDGTIGLVNNFISGINGYGYKVYSDTIHESTIYYSLLNSINLDIISKCSKGSVIKHASSSKDKLLIFDYKEVNIKAIYSLEIMLKKKLLLIDKIIKYSIEKYVL